VPQPEAQSLRRDSAALVEQALNRHSATVCAFQVHHFVEEREDGRLADIAEDARPFWAQAITVEANMTVDSSPFKKRSRVRWRPVTICLDRLRPLSVL